MRQLAFSDFVILFNSIGITLALAAFGLIFGALLGAVIAMLRIAKFRVLRWLAMGYIRIFQGTPLMLQLFLIFFGTAFLGFPLDAFPSAILGFALYAGAFLGDIWRGAIETVPKGQTEAARALAMRYWPTMFKVIVPQAVRVSIPPTVGFVMVLLKSTSVAALVGVTELTQTGQHLNNVIYNPFAIFGAVALVYFAMCFPLTVLSRYLERRLVQQFNGSGIPRTSLLTD
jgi:polar amino acid transport system permease protein